jgi:hypothetical protein
MSYKTTRLPGGKYRHHDGSSTSSPPSGTWIQALVKAINKSEDSNITKADLKCAKFGCNCSAELGAHVRVGFCDEALKWIGKGGTYVLPCCQEHHPKSGDLSFKTKSSFAIIDKGTVMDNEDLQDLKTTGLNIVKCLDPVAGFLLDATTTN